MKNPAVLLLLATAAVHAQTHRVDAAAPVTRAVAVYEYTGDLAKPTAARLVPVSLFIDAQLQDGGTYLARPVPLALLNDTIYSLDRAGLPQGTLTLAYARHLQSAATSSANITDLGWFGYGVFAPPPVARKPVILEASTVRGITSSKDAGTAADSSVAEAKPDRPHFGRKSPPASSPSPTTATTAPASTPTDDPDRPHLSKSTPADPNATVTGDVDGGKPAAQDAPQDSGRKTDTTTPTAPQDETDRPTLRHRDPKQAEADRKAAQKVKDHGSVSGVGDLNTDPNRPTMRRGKPTGADAAPSQLTGLPPTLHQIVAVSDAVTREPHPFHRDWDSPAEQATTTAALARLAQPLVAQYAYANNFSLAGAGAATPHAAARARARLPETHVTFANEQVTALTLSYGGLPTFLYTAEASTTGAPTPLTLFLTVVAQRQPSGELQAALSSVTDSAHLDRTPQLRFVDAVDPDASNRASLLFELRGQTIRQFALYRILAAHADQTFVTNPTD